MKPRRRRCSARSARIPRRPWRKPPSSRSKSNRGAPRLSVLLTKKSRVLVQGITGHQGQFHTRAMIDFGTKVVAGVTPGRGGTKVEGVPVFDSVREAVHRRRANASIIFVPAPYAKDAAIEAIEGGLKLVVIIGTSMVDALAMFQKDRKTKRIVVVGEIGGTAEEEAADFIKRRVTKPIVAYVAGRTAPPGKRMGHAGAIIQGNRGTAESKVKAFVAAGVPVAEYPVGIPKLLAAT